MTAEDVPDWTRQVIIEYVVPLYVDFEGSASAASSQSVTLAAAAEVNDALLFLWATDLNEDPTTVPGGAYKLQTETGAPYARLYGYNCAGGELTFDFADTGASYSALVVAQYRRVSVSASQEVSIFTNPVSVTPGKAPWFYFLGGASYLSTNTALGVPAGFTVRGHVAVANPTSYINLTIADSLYSALATETVTLSSGGAAGTAI